MNKIYPKVPAIAKPSPSDFSRTLDELARAKVGELIQAVLIEEINEYVRRLPAEANGKAQNAHRDGYEDERMVTYGSLPVTIRRPRVRGVEEPFVSEVLPPYRHRFSDVDKALHELWDPRPLDARFRAVAACAACREDAALAFDDLPREQAVLEEYEAWCKRDLVNDFVYLWADGIYLGAGPEDERRVMLTVIGVDTNGNKALLALADAMSESAESWSAVFEDLHPRGVHDVAITLFRKRIGVISARRTSSNRTSMSFVREPTFASGCAAVHRRPISSTHCSFVGAHGDASSTATSC